MDLLSRITALLDDTSPRAVATLRYIQALLEGEVVIPGGIKMLMAELGCDGYVNSEIDDERFPGADLFVSFDGVVPVDIGKDWTDPEAIAFLAAMSPPMKPVNPDKGIKWATANKNAQRENPLVILGQKCLRSRGDVCVLVLGELDGKRVANLFVVQFRFFRYCRVLAERME